MHSLCLICNGFFHIQNFTLVHIRGINTHILSLSVFFSRIQMLPRFVAALLKGVRKMRLDIDVIMLSHVPVNQSCSTALQNSLW